MDVGVEVRGGGKSFDAEDVDLGVGSRRTTCSSPSLTSLSPPDPYMLNERVASQLVANRIGVMANTVRSRMKSPLATNCYPWVTDVDILGRLSGYASDGTSMACLCGIWPRVR